MTVNFSLLALDQIVNTAAALRHMSGGQFSVPLVLRMATGAGRQLAAQHSHSLENWYAHIPGIKVLAPATIADARGMLGPALADPDPVVIFEHAQLYNLEGELPDDWRCDIASAAVRRQGTDVSLITYGGSLPKALAAAEQLAAEGIEAEVIDLRVLRPLDTATIAASLRKTHKAVVVDEGWRSGSLAAEVMARIVEEASSTSTRRWRASAARKCRSPTRSTWRKRPAAGAEDRRRSQTGARKMIEFKLPSLGADMDEGKLLEWKVSPGDTVKKGQVVAIVDTSKAAVDVEIWSEGTVCELLVSRAKRSPSARCWQPARGARNAGDDSRPRQRRRPRAGVSRGAPAARGRSASRRPHASTRQGTRRRHRQVAGTGPGAPSRWRTSSGGAEKSVPPGRRPHPTRRRKCARPSPRR
jgi:biotin carboxyl carrier protein